MTDRWRRLFLVLPAWMWVVALQAQPATAVCDHDSCASRHPWCALGEVVLANGIVHLTSRYAMNEPYSNTTLNTIRENLSSGFSWDNDSYLLNQMGHPCQGTLYFNAARSNGFNYWQSLPFTLAGSLIWEMAGESEKPSLNDVVTTTVAGAGLGEVTHRLAGRIINEHDRGGRRLLREVAAAAINPVEGFNRLVTGRAWKVSRHLPSVTDDGEEQDTDAPRLMVGARYVAAADDFSSGSFHPFFAFSIDYGLGADGERHTTPYDFFAGEAMLAFGGGQPLVSHLSVTGRICSTPIVEKERALGELGLYQHLRYEDAQVGDSAQGAPFPYGEMASVGPGVMFSFPRLTPSLSAEQRIFVRGIALGTVKSDHLHFYERDYNYGSGYGITAMSRLKWQRVGMFQVDVNYMHLFSWKGYEQMDLTDVDTDCLSVMGDHSHARVLSVGLKARATLTQHLSLQVVGSHISRYSYYRYYPTRRTSCYEMLAALQYRL